VNPLSPKAPAGGPISNPLRFSKAPVAGSKFQSVSKRYMNMPSVRAVCFTSVDVAFICCVSCPSVSDHRPRGRGGIQRHLRSASWPLSTSAAMGSSRQLSPGVYRPRRPLLSFAAALPPHGLPMTSLRDARSASSTGATPPLIGTGLENGSQPLPRRDNSIAHAPARSDSEASMNVGLPRNLTTPARRAKPMSGLGGGSGRARHGLATCFWKITPQSFALISHAWVSATRTRLRSGRHASPHSM
jgi:hypothetical protein